MPQIPAAEDWYAVVPVSTLDREEGDLHGAAQVFMVPATDADIAAQMVFDAHPEFPGCMVLIGQWYVR